MNLSNKIALVTGGARIGLTVAEELAKKGCDVALTYRTSRRAAADAAEKVIKHGRKAVLLQADVTKEKDVKKIMGQLKNRFGRLHLLINMASVYEETPLSRLNERVWNEIMDANLKSAYLTVLHARSLLMPGQSRVINFSDWVAASGRPRYKNFIPYFTAKTGVIGLTQVQALELAPDILVNAIAPGPILPPRRIANEEIRNVAKVTPLKKWGGPLEIAKAVIFLAETDFITGECVRVDGGRHLL